MKILIAIFVLILQGFFGTAHANTSAAAGLPASNYSQSGIYSIYDAQFAFNGGGWNAGGFGWQWLQVDLGSVKNISEVSFSTSQLPNGTTNHKVFVSNDSIGNNWTSMNSVASHSGYTSNGSFINMAFAPVLGRYLEIAVHNGPSWTALSNVVVSVSSVPEPETYAMLVTGLGLMGVFLRRRKINLNFSY